MVGGWIEGNGGSGGMVGGGNGWSEGNGGWVGRGE